MFVQKKWGLCRLRWCPSGKCGKCVETRHKGFKEYEYVCKRCYKIYTRQQMLDAKLYK
jgi:hypothetical protein